MPDTSAVLDAPVDAVLAWDTARPQDVAPPPDAWLPEPMLTHTCAPVAEPSTIPVVFPSEYPAPDLLHALGTGWVLSADGRFVLLAPDGQPRSTIVDVSGPMYPAMNLSRKSLVAPDGDTFWIATPYIGDDGTGLLLANYGADGMVRARGFARVNSYSDQPVPLSILVGRDEILVAWKIDPFVPDLEYSFFDRSAMATDSRRELGYGDRTAGLVQGSEFLLDVVNQHLGGPRTRTLFRIRRPGEPETLGMPQPASMFPRSYTEPTEYFAFGSGIVGYNAGYFIRMVSPMPPTFESTPFLPLPGEASNTAPLTNVIAEQQGEFLVVLARASTPGIALYDAAGHRRSPFLPIGTRDTRVSDLAVASDGTIAVIGSGTASGTSRFYRFRCEASSGTGSP